MVDAVVSYAVQKLGDFIIQEAVAFKGIKDDVKQLGTDLGFMRPYILDAEQKQGSDERIRTWISELQEIAYDAEDIIKRFNKEQIHSSSCYCCICNNAKLYDIGKDIGALKKRLNDINTNKVKFGLDGTGIAHIGGRRINCGDQRLDDVVGFEDDVQILQTELFNGVQSCKVISILGMGGLGKTTLARKLYDNNQTGFTLHAWICVCQDCVSQDWKTEDLLKILIKSLEELTKENRENVDKMELFELTRYLRSFVEKHRYLVVINDVGCREAWENIKNALPDNNNGSRIIITTRNEDVAQLFSDVTLVHKLQFLRDKESWLLFCKKAFPNGVCPDRFEKLGREMIIKCGGLPLAIVLLGGFLSGKGVHEWEEVNKHIWREVNRDAQDKSVMSRLLDLSYNDLSNGLKLCFLYLCIFPDDHLIEVEELVKLWVAEGFIPIDEEGRTPEEVSKGYFKELLKRNLVQTVEENWSMTSSCRVHGLLRYLALTKARETNFFRVCDEIGSSAALSSTSCRRFAVYSGDQREELLNRSHKKVRTLYFLNAQRSIHYEANKMIDISVVWSFKLLLVLKIEGVDLSDAERKSNFFKVVGEMIQLGYFGLKDTYIDELPDSIRNLKALQTLNIEPLDLRLPVKLPKDICELKELRHLEGHFSVDLSNLAELTNLQTLKVMIQNKATIGENCNFLATLKNLRTSKMQQSPVSDTIPIEPLFNCKQLIELKIMGGGSIREVPKGIHENLKKLKYLELFLSEPEKDPISKLEMLPSLFALHLSYHQDKTISWTFKANGFPQLKFLKLGNASNMDLSVDERAMPNLQFLCLENDRVKETLPEKFRRLRGEEAMKWKFSKYRNSHA